MEGKKNNGWRMQVKVRPESSHLFPSKNMEMFFMIFLLRDLKNSTVTVVLCFFLLGGRFDSWPIKIKWGDETQSWLS